MKGTFSTLVALYFMGLVAIFTGSCGGGSCPEPENSELFFPIESGTYTLVSYEQGVLAKGVPQTATAEIDREAQTARLTYSLEGGASIVEEYEFDSPVRELSQSY